MATYRTDDQIRETARAMESAGAPEKDIEQFVKLAVEERSESDRRSSRVAPSPYGIGTGVGMQREDEVRLAETTKDAARYGPAIIAGLATGGAGFLPTLAATAGAGAIGESAAQRLEMVEGSRSAMSGRDVAAAAITSPMGTPLRVGSGLLKAGANIGFNAALGEAGLAVQNEGFQAPQSALEGIARVGIPTGIGIASALGDAARTIGTTRAAANAISTERLLQPGQGVLLSEVLPKMKGLPEAEQKMFKDGVTRLRVIADDMTVGLSDALAGGLAKTGLIDEEIAGVLQPYMGQLKNAETAHAAAVQASEAAQARLADLKTKGLAPEVIEKARNEATLTAAKEIEFRDLRKGIAKKILGGAVPTLGDDAGAVASAALKDRVKVLDDAYAGARDKMYKQVGIRINDPVVSRKEFNAALTKARKKSGSLLAGDLAYNRIVAQADKVFGPAPKADGPPGGFVGFSKVAQATDVAAPSPTITREAFLNFRDKLAGELALETDFAKTGNKIAAEAYDALTLASENFIGRTNPEKANALKKANKVMADIYGTRASDALEKLRAGDIDGFTDAVVKEGPGAINDKGKATGFWAEVTAYAKAGTRLAARAGDSQANEAVGAFYKDLGRAMKNSIATRSLDPATSLTAPVIDMGKFTAKLQEMANRGVKMEWMKIDPAHVRAARGMAEKLQGGLMEPAQLDKFLDDAATLGVNRASTKMEVEKLAELHYANSLRTPLANQKQLEAQILELTGNVEAAEKALSEARSSPIARLLGDTNLGLSNDPMQNGQWVSKMIVAGPSTAKAAVEALIKEGKTDTLEKLRTAVVAHIFNGFMEADISMKTKGGFRVRVDDVKDYFNNPKHFRRTETLKALMGPDRWDAVNTMKAPMERASTTLARLNARPYPSNLPDATVLVAGAGRAAGAGGNLPIMWVKGTANAAMNLHRQARYATLNLLYIDPVWSKRFEAAGRNVEKFIQNPAAAVAYRLATQQDDELTANGNARP